VTEENHDELQLEYPVCGPRLNIARPKHKVERLLFGQLARFDGSVQHFDWYLYIVNSQQYFEDTFWKIETRQLGRGTVSKISVDKTLGLSLNRFVPCCVYRCSWKVRTNFGHEFHIPTQEKSRTNIFPETFNLWVKAERMHGGAPAHFSRAARGVLSNTHHDRWISREGPAACPPFSPDLNPLDCYLWGHVKLLCMQLLLTTKRHFTVALWMRQTIHNYPDILNGCGGAWWVVSRLALNVMEDILSTYYKRTPSAVTHKLNISCHMLIWTFFLVLVCGTRAQSLSAPFGYSLHSLILHTELNNFYIWRGSGRTKCNISLQLVNLYNF
jgi:hypothetical protein